MSKEVSVVDYLNQIVVLLPLLFVVLVCMAALLDRDWSAEQKEMWKNEEAYWVHRSQGNVEEFTALLHDDFAGWPSWAAMPIDKIGGRKFLEEEVKSAQILSYDIHPAAIRVFDGVGIVYYIGKMRKAENGKQAEKGEQTIYSRYTHVWMKQGGSWKLIGGDSVPVSGERLPELLRLK